MKILRRLIIIAVIVLACILCSLVNAEISESKAIINNNSSSNGDSDKESLESNAIHKSETVTFNISSDELIASDSEPPNEDLSHLVAANVALASRVAILENRVL